MTCIITIRCRDGIVVASDRRIVQEYEAHEEDKIHQIGQIILASTGLTGIRDKFMSRAIERMRLMRVTNLREALEQIEDAAAEISERYMERLREEKGLLGGFVAGLEELTEGEPHVYRIYASGYADEIRTYDVAGHAADYVKPFLKLLYEPKIDCETGAKIAAFCILLIEKLGIDQTVGGGPDIVLITEEGEEKIRFLGQEDIERIVEGLPEIAQRLSNRLNQIFPQ